MVASSGRGGRQGAMGPIPYRTPLDYYQWKRKKGLKKEKKKRTHQTARNIFGQREGRILIHEGSRRQHHDGLDLSLDLGQRKWLSGMVVRVLDAGVLVHRPLMDHQG